MLAAKSANDGTDSGAVTWRSGITALIGKDMIRPAAASFAGDVAFRFKHILVREAAYRATAKKLRVSRSKLYATALSEYPERHRAESVTAFSARRAARFRYPRGASSG